MTSGHGIISNIYLVLNLTDKEYSVKIYGQIINYIEETLMCIFRFLLFIYRFLVFRNNSFSNWIVKNV